MELPEQIEPCPINEALVEVRFLPSVPEDAVFGVLYQQLEDEYPNVENLPITQLPEKVRKDRQDLEFKPYHRLPGDPFVVQIGPRVISIVNKGDYQGWDRFSETVWYILQRLEESNVVESIHRYSLRYTNFFDENVYEISNIDITSGDRNLVGDETYLKTLVEHDGDFNSILQATNTASISENGQRVTGSIVDIDTIDTSVEDADIFFDTYEERIESAHENEKSLFFGILTEEFLESLDVQY